jgi:nucleotide-binding universal stress UspA family protein
MKILAAVDESSNAVIQEAARRPWPQRSEFRVVTVIDPYFFSHASKVLEEAKQSAAKALEDLAGPLVSGGWNVHLEVLLDNPRHVLPRVSLEWNADLVMIGSHVVGAVKGLLLGSTEQIVLRHAECSVEIVRTRANTASDHDGMRVLLATDGSDHAEAAMAMVAESSWPQGSEFKVISIPEYPVLIGEYPYYAPEQISTLVQQTREHSKRAATSGAEKLAKPGLNASSEVREPQDTPAHGILAAAEKWNADLIVLGSHGRRGFDRLILGSVSETVAMHANCSVEVVRMPIPQM